MSNLSLIWCVAVVTLAVWFLKDAMPAALHLEEGEHQMAVATVKTPTRRFDLKTCPEGYVVIKRMNHGQKLFRQDMSSKMQIDAGKKTRNVKAEIDMNQTQVAHWEFANLIVEHNLTDEND